MPSTRELRKRGGVRKVRTITLPDGRYAHIYVVRRAGPRGGHTELGEIRKRKGRRK